MTKHFLYEMLKVLLETDNEELIENTVFNVANIDSKNWSEGKHDKYSEVKNFLYYAYGEMTPEQLMALPITMREAIIKVGT